MERDLRLQTLLQSKSLNGAFGLLNAVETILDGQKTTGVFEALDLHRFRNPVILAMLAVRVPRRKRWTFK